MSGQHTSQRQIGFWIDRGLYRTLIKLAQERGTTVTAVVRAMILRGIREEDKHGSEETPVY